MKIKIACLYITLLLCACNNHNSRFKNIKYNGLITTNVEYQNGYEEIFYANGIKNGAFVKYNNLNKLVEYGTYKNDKKDGLWTTISSKGINQYYFIKDSIFIKTDSDIQFDWIIDTPNNLSFFSPKNWLIDLRNQKFLNSTVMYIGQSPKLNNEFPPKFNIVRLDIKDTLFNIAWDKQLKNLRENKSYTIKESGQDYVIYEADTERGSIYVYTKMIKINNQYISLGCLANEKEYSKLKPLFTTIINSFNPIYLSIPD